MLGCRARSGIALEANGLSREAIGRRAPQDGAICLRTAATREPCATRQPYLATPSEYPEGSASDLVLARRTAVEEKRRSLGEETSVLGGSD